ncbi:hypothetical protein GCM10009839_51920 [Catenulispora yoronensis]|uniref:ATP-grasp domain-containing protein n=1 Tax=Catenulispora yoronensis TaxID=450799 RepID=A0ABP5G9U9_9ACTN
MLRRYPFVTRMAAELFNSGALSNVEDIEIEPEFGHTTRIRYTGGRVRMTRGNDVGLNSGAACEVVRDKAFTRYFLQLQGVTCARGQSFLLNWWADLLRPRAGVLGPELLRTVDQMLPYIREQLRMPVYVKPVDGSKGQNIWCCRTEQEVVAALDGYERERVKVALVEQDVALPDYRLVVLDGELISAYERRPLQVEGDGVGTIAELVGRLQLAFRADQRDTVLTPGDRRIAARLAANGLTWDSVPAAGVRVRLHDISNLSAGGTAVEYTDTVCERWRLLAIDICAQFGLRFGGVDLACSDLTAPDGDYAVLEVNASPGLDHYGSVGATQAQIVRRLYARVLNTIP